jgi:hypothetical protein
VVPRLMTQGGWKMQCNVCEFHKGAGVKAHKTEKQFFEPITRDSFTCVVVVLVAIGCAAREVRGRRVRGTQNLPRPHMFTSMANIGIESFLFSLLERHHVISRATLPTLGLLAVERDLAAVDRAGLALGPPQLPQLLRPRAGSPACGHPQTGPDPQLETTQKRQNG